MALGEKNADFRFTPALLMRSVVSPATRAACVALVVGDIERDGNHAWIVDIHVTGARCGVHLARTACQQTGDELRTQAAICARNEGDGVAIGHERPLNEGEVSGERDFEQFQIRTAPSEGIRQHAGNRDAVIRAHLPLPVALHDIKAAR